MGISHRQMVRKHLDWDVLLQQVRERFATIPDSRSKDHTISLSDALMSGFALFALKDPSLLAFQPTFRYMPEGVCSELYSPLKWVILLIYIGDGKILRKSESFRCVHGNNSHSHRPVRVVTRNLLVNPPLDR